jgi:Leucine-rich repeat (LRR) protein
VSDRLDLRGRELSAVPGEVWEARGLRSLALGRNPLGALPDAIGSLTSLTALYLDATGIEALPEAVGRLQELRTLDVAHNRLAALPAGVAALRALEVLYAAASCGCDQQGGRTGRLRAEVAELSGITPGFRDQSRTVRARPLAR